MTLYQLDDADAVLGADRLDVRAADHLHPRAERRLEAETLVDEVDVVVDGLRHRDDADGEPAPRDLRDDRDGAAASPVTSHDEEHADPELDEPIYHRARVLIAARGAEHGAARVVDLRDEVGRELDGLVP